MLLFCVLVSQPVIIETINNFFFLDVVPVQSWHNVPQYSRFSRKTNLLYRFSTQDPPENARLWSRGAISVLPSRENAGRRPGSGPRGGSRRVRNPACVSSSVLY